ncbi:hypothetical protein BGZ49_005753 [Haplosporangium sp. Z 27]|nr:hypothetical protein BGZ49_005753 [Haplosporangium sp. Z 27]
MPPKRSQIESTKRKPTTVSTPKRKRENASAIFKRPQSEDEEDEKEIETVKDYEDAVRRRIMNSTTKRYDDPLEQDYLPFAANLMMPASELQPSELETIDDQNHKVIYSLSTYCLYTIAKEFKYLASDDTTSSAEKFTQQQRKPQGRYRRLGKEQHTGKYFRKRVQQMPYYLSVKLFRLLRHTSPELLSAKIWTNLFFPADSTEVFDDGGDGKGFNNLHITDLDLEGLIPSQVTDAIIRGHILQTLNLGPQLEKINLNSMDALSDKVLSQLVEACPHLTRLSLKGCTKAGDMTLANLPSKSLEELNISFVAAPTAKGIKQLILQCRELRILKIAGVVNVKDGLFLQLEKELAQEMEVALTRNSPNTSVYEPQSLPLYKLENLKISSTKLGDRGFKFLMSLCGRSLRRLDISATDVGRIGPIAQFCIWDDNEIVSSPASSSPVSSRVTCLEKLNLTRLKITSPNDLITLFKRLPPNSLHTLLIGYLACGQVPIRDELLNELGRYLEPAVNIVPGHDIIPKATLQCNPFSPPLPSSQEFHLHTLSLFGNSQIGQSKRQDFGLHLLLRRLSPFLRRLELGYTQCKSSILEGLLEPLANSHASDLTLALSYEDRMVDNLVLEELGLDETPIDDEATTVLSRFRRLNRLSLVNTRIGKEAVEKVVIACPLLKSLDLTSCRGIPLLHRRTLLKDVRQSCSN